MGRRAQDGDEYKSANGYRYRRVLGKWKLVHVLIAQENLGRALRPNEGTYFIDGNRANLDPGNIGVRIKGQGKGQRRLAQIEERIRELEAERDLILEDLDNTQS